MDLFEGFLDGNFLRQPVGPHLHADLRADATFDAATTVTQDGVTPLLVCDVWEHAYYLDYKNVRKEFLEKWFDNLANWAFAARQYAAALGQGDRYRYPSPDGQA